MSKKRPNVYRQGKGWIVDCGLVDGKRRRIYRSTKAAADRLAAEEQEKSTLEGMGVAALSPPERIDAANALRILAGTGVTLEEMARREIERGATKTTMLVSELYAEFYAKKKKLGLRAGSLRSIKDRAGRFSKDVDGIYIGDMTGPMIEEWLDRSDVKPVSRNAYLRGIRSMFNYALRQGYISSNPAQRVDFVKERLQQPKVFSPDQATAILSWCIDKKPALVPYYAIAIFAGLRPDEIKRATKAEINLPDRIITVTPDMSKTHMRHVKISDNLFQWLEKYPAPKKGPLFWKRYWKDEMVSDLALDWPHDVCRKTFISYHLAAFRNQTETIQEAGHRNADMIFTYYRNIQTFTGDQITQDYAKAFWKISPASVKKWKAAQVKKQK